MKSLSTIRFDPPRVAVSHEIRWALRRAFAPVTVEVPVVDPEAVLGVCERLDLLARIGGRVPASILEAQLGSAAAFVLSDAYHRTAAQALQLAALAAQIAAIAGRRGIPLVFLKFLALHCAGAVQPGLRPAQDIDILVSGAQARLLFELLRAAGFEASDDREHDHQLPPLVHPSGAVVEIHLLIPGVRPPGEKTFATLETLREHGLLESAPGFPAGCWLPRLEVRLAHALVHGIAQHGYSPSAYPMLRMVADLIDCDVVAEHAVVRHVLPLVEREVGPGEVEGAVGLARRLAQGDDELLDSFAGADGLLLQHCLAGAFVPEYAESLRVSSLRHALTDRSRTMATARLVLLTLFPSRRQIEKIYGLQSHASGYLWRRALRPFDLVLRLVRTLFAHRQLGVERRRRRA